MAVEIPSNTPTSFQHLDERTAQRALDGAWEAVHHTQAADRLRRYYNPDGEFAGRSFTDLLAGPDTAPNDFTATDLLAVTLLSVDPPRPRRVRQFLDDGGTRTGLLELLRDPAVGVDVRIELADTVTLEAMQQLYRLVKSTLGGNPWVTASKLCARKRPQLFPVRDRLVCHLLGIGANHEVDWQTFRLLMLQHDLVQALHNLHDEVRNQVTLDNYPLRWLDVLLWMHAKDKYTR